ncbi:MAG: PaaI family thioesterase [Lachnospiraceae bacterium]|nr:PaaI family thioesterase [Lachnospiraceae bacterium]
MTAEQKEILSDLVRKNRYMQSIGIELLELKEGYARGRLPFSEDIVNPYGSMHGGVLYSLADTIAGLAACTCGRYSSTIDGGLHYLRPAMGTAYVYCEAHVLRQGRQIAVYRAELLDDRGVLLDTGEFTYFMLEEEV